MSTLAALGFVMVLIFMYLIMSKRMSAITALILVPLAFGLTLNYGNKVLGKMMMDGVKAVAPTAIMICFAILFFGIMIDAGLFDPLIKKILAIVKGDPVKVSIGTALLAALVSLDGDGSTTYLVTTTAMFAVHRRLGMHPMILPAVTIMMNSIMNIIPWGGPTGRILAALKVEAGDVFVPMIPAMVLGAVWVLYLAYRWGKQERDRLGIVDLNHLEMAATETVDPEVEKLKRPHLFWVNFTLTIALLVALVLEVFPLAVLFIIGTGMALLINYPNLKEQGARVTANGANAMSVVGLIFAAGIFMGIMSGTKMGDAMAKAIVDAIPISMGPHFALITSFLSLPGTFFMTNDAFYFGVLPVLAKAASAYGISAAEMGRAALIGQGSHLLSPLVASTYLLVGMNNIEFGDLQKFTLLPAVSISMIWLAYAVLTGLIHL